VKRKNAVKSINILAFLSLDAIWLIKAQAPFKCILSFTFPGCFGRNISYTITAGFLEELDVNASHQAPPFSVIIWRMFVRRPLGM